jgi:hypothetical protein
MLVENPMAVRRNSPSFRQSDLRSTIALTDNGDTSRLGENIFTSQEWEKIHLISDYNPNINGTLNPEYVSLRAKMQTDLNVKIDAQENSAKVEISSKANVFTPVPAEIIEDEK